MLSDIPRAAISLLTILRINSSVDSPTFWVNSSRNNTEKSEAACFKGCGVIPGKDIVREFSAYPNMLFSMPAMADFPDPVLPVISKAG